LFPTTLIAMSDPPFDFARYFDRVQHTALWHRMQLGMAAYGGVVAGQRILDVGTGPGRLIYELQQDGVQAIGVDASCYVLDRLRARYPSAPLAVGLAERLPFTADSFDAALAGNILFFLPNPLAALVEMVRVVRPGGMIVNWSPSERMSVSAAQGYMTRHPELDPFEARHLVNWAQVAESHRRWTPDELEWYFTTAHLTAFDTETTLDGLARFTRGRVPLQSAQ